MKCKFCTSEATHKCTFKLPDARIVFASEIQKLDLIRDDVHLVYRPVKQIVVNQEEYALLKLAGEKRSTIERHVNPRLPILRMEIHECGNQVCENHIREFDEENSQCAEHWPDEKVYGTN